MRPALAIGLLAFVAMVDAAESLESRLVRSIQTGSLQGATASEIRAVVRTGGATYLAFPLSVATLKAGGYADASAQWTAERLLDKTLEELHPGLAFPAMADRPAGFAGEDIAFLLVHALVLGGETGKAVAVLARHAATGGKFKRAVSLQALRNIGSPEANAIIQKAAASGELQQLASNLLADLHYPFLHEIASRQRLVARSERGGPALARHARERCGERAALAVYYLGFLPDAPDRSRQESELELLRELSGASCYHTRHFALRSLALRSPESIAFWGERYRADQDAWIRALLVRIAWARFGPDFEATALEWLADERAQYVQWELAHGYLESRRGVRLRNYWDLWNPRTLQLRLDHPPRPEREAAEFGALLAWLEAGHRPADPWVRNHLLYGMAKSVSGRETRRLLAVFSELADRREHAWILAPLGDPSALPLLRFWEQGETGRSREELTRTITRLESAAGDRAGPRLGRCCRPTTDCLLSQVESGDAGREPRITDEAQARRWLLEGSGDSRPQVLYLDPLERAADVTAGGSRQRWEHLYGCWRRTDGALAR